MNHRPNFVFSHKPFAVKMDSLIGTLHTVGERTSYRGRIQAVWFRRKDGITRACIGTLWDFQDREAEPTALDFLTAHDDGRHGGDCDGRWDGKRYWGAQDLDTMEQHLQVLRPVLEGFHATDGHPEIPEGYDGWWSFR